MLKFEVWMSLSCAPAALRAAITAATRLLFSATASSTVRATVCTPTLNEKRSGVTLERPVPLTLTVSGGGMGMEGVCAKEAVALVRRMTAERNLFMEPPGLLRLTGIYIQSASLLRINGRSPRQSSRTSAGSLLRRYAVHRLRSLPRDRARQFHAERRGVLLVRLQAAGDAGRRDALQRRDGQLSGRSDRAGRRELVV